MDNYNIEDRIKLVRNTVNLTQEAFGRKLGVRKGVIVNIELHRKAPIAPDDPFLELISSIYHVNLDWLLTGDGEMFSDNANPLSQFLAQESNLSPAANLVLQRFDEMNDKERDEFLTAIKTLMNM